MKIIDLLNKIANGEELPKKIKISDYFLELNKNKNNYLYEDNEEYYGKDLIHWFSLNDEVEILEEEKKITPTDFENLGYALGSIQKYINKGYDKAIEEKKIPEKLIPTSLKGIDNLDEKIEIAHIDTMSVLDTVNEIIDYLKSKGE